jgi:hypothetical protein
MFTEYDIAGICERTGLRSNGTGWRDLMRENQFSAAAANQGHIAFRGNTTQSEMAFLGCWLLDVGCCLLATVCCMLPIVYYRTTLH